MSLYRWVLGSTILRFVHACHSSLIEHHGLIEKIKLNCFFTTKYHSCKLSIIDHPVNLVTLMVDELGDDVTLKWQNWTSHGSRFVHSIYHLSTNQHISVIVYRIMHHDLFKDCSSPGIIYQKTWHSYVSL